MGLMRLLAVGRSWGKIGDQPSRYKMTQQSLLPRFGSVKKALEERAPGVGEMGHQVTAKTELKQSSLGFAAAANDSKNMNVQPKTQETAVPKPALPRQAFPLGRWTLFKNPFSRTPAPKKAEASVQRELSLDTVRPVRNDLSDADLELVRSTKNAPEKITPTMPQLEPVSVVPGNEAWDRIKTQFFGAGKA